MDPLTIAAFALLASLAATPPAQGFAGPPVTLPDVAERILHCYHPTARFAAVDLVEQPWSRGAQYQADSSALLQIDYTGGFTNHPYVLDVALLNHAGWFRGVIQSDSALIGANQRCGLNRWVPVYVQR